MVLTRSQYKNVSKKYIIQEPTDTYSRFVNDIIRKLNDFLEKINVFASKYDKGLFRVTG